MGGVGVFDAAAGEEGFVEAAPPEGFFSLFCPAEPVLDEVGLADWAKHALARQ